MRTLFLLGILFTLIVIAVKKPDQTAWDAARELKEQAKEVIAKVEPPVVESLKPLSDSKAWKDVEETVTKAVNTLKETEGSSSTNIDNKKDTATPIEDWNLDPRSPAKETAPKPAVSPLPDIQAVPVPPVQLVEKLEELKIPPVTRVRAPAVSNYVDVKVYYEQANRFLDEIK
jgi:hypothetical protein